MDPIDRHVGNRIRVRRMQTGTSQERLGDALGLTFQQVQKYEKGTNRVSASKLVRIAKALDVKVEFFFEGGPGFANDGKANASDPITFFAATREGNELITAWPNLRPGVRRAVVDLVVSAAEG